MRAHRFVIARERNVIQVDFRREPDPPAPKFPGAAALRNASWWEPADTVNPTLITAEVA
jgi:hypothetical protein